VQLSMTGLPRFVFSLLTSEIISWNFTKKSRKTTHSNPHDNCWYASMNSHACIIWFSVLTVITSITSCLCPMYQIITIYTIASNIVLTEMIGRHAVVFVRHFMLFLNNICIIQKPICIIYIHFLRTNNSKVYT
jgi:hypothetical protein